MDDSNHGWCQEEGKEVDAGGSGAKANHSDGGDEAVARALQREFLGLRGYRLPGWLSTAWMFIDSLDGYRLP